TIAIAEQHIAIRQQPAVLWRLRGELPLDRTICRDDGHFVSLVIAAQKAMACRVFSACPQIESRQRQAKSSDSPAREVTAGEKRCLVHGPIDREEFVAVQEHAAHCRETALRSVRGGVRALLGGRFALEREAEGPPGLECAGRAQRRRRFAPPPDACGIAELMRDTPAEPKAAWRFASRRAPRLHHPVAVKSRWSR